ncbi:zinc ABC transporter substrate-binding protein ZnuA [Aurantivibrio plasticivorans]
MGSRLSNQVSRVNNHGGLRPLHVTLGKFIAVLLMSFLSLSGFADNDQALTSKATANGDLMSVSPAKLDVVVSIRPIALILEELLGDLISTRVLVPTNASPHDYTLKASDVKALYAADYVVWLGPELEQFMTKLLSNISEKRTITLTATIDHPNNTHHNHSNHTDHHEHHADNHQWLDPQAVRVMAKHIVTTLSAEHPELANQLADKHAVFAEKIATLDQQLSEKYALVKHTPFVVYHRGYDALVEHFGLQQLGWVTINPEQSPSVRHLVELQKSIKEVSINKPVKCLFFEVSGNAEVANRIAGQLGLQAVALDILGADVRVESYSAMLNNIVTDMQACLATAQ